ncbi:MAG: apolipoprotein N-acyltransferase [Candidatus Adiutrix intracellularis]|nr:apolipoprotein N-acyltransferase [Candidatus Adiutrix intracellularis]
MAENRWSTPTGPLFQGRAWPFFLAAGGGLLQTLSWPEPGWWPLCFVALIPLLLAAEGQRNRRSFALGWVYGLALVLSSLPWLADVLVDYGRLGLLLGWFIFLLLGAFLALYPALFSWIISGETGRPIRRVLVGSTAWAGLDWLKNWVFTGFNWTPLAGPLVLSSEMGQAADLFGIYGLGFFVALINMLLAAALTTRFKPGTGPRLLLTRVGFLAMALFLMGVAFIYGWGQFIRWETAAASAPRPLVMAIQPATDQLQKWDEAYRDSLLTFYDYLARTAGRQKPWLILWPETALPFIFDYDYLETKWLKDLNRDLGGLSLVGVAGTNGLWQEMKLYNRMLLFKDGEAGLWYDKNHLVPFGEYLPLEWLPFLKWPFLQGLIGAAGTYAPGVPRQLLELPLSESGGGIRVVKLGVLICFESTFPYLGRDRALAGADLLVVPTNDGWFGRSRAPGQHLLAAAMRTVEIRRPLVRVGNTGISAVIHPSGRITQTTPLYKAGVFPLWVPILTPADEITTVFVRWGYFLAPLLAVLTSILAIFRFREQLNPLKRRVPGFVSN